jgi:hypothetical protein
MREMSSFTVSVALICLRQCFIDSRTFLRSTFTFHVSKLSDLTRKTYINIDVKGN